MSKIRSNWDELEKPFCYFKLKPTFFKCFCYLIYFFFIDEVSSSCNKTWIMFLSRDKIIQIVFRQFPKRIKLLTSHLIKALMLNRMVWLQKMESKVMLQMEWREVIDKLSNQIQKWAIKNQVLSGCLMITWIIEIFCFRNFNLCF